MSHVEIASRLLSYCAYSSGSSQHTIGELSYVETQRFLALMHPGAGTSTSTAAIQAPNTSVRCSNETDIITQNKVDENSVQLFFDDHVECYEIGTFVGLVTTSNFKGNAFLSTTSGRKYDLHPSSTIALRSMGLYLQNLFSPSITKDDVGKILEVRNSEVFVDGVKRPVNWMWLQCPDVSSSKITKVNFPVGRDGEYELALDDVILESGSVIANPLKVGVESTERKIWNAVRTKERHSIAFTRTNGMWRHKDEVKVFDIHKTLKTPNHTILKQTNLDTKLLSIVSEICRDTPDISTPAHPLQITHCLSESPPYLILHTTNVNKYINIIIDELRARCALPFSYYADKPGFCMGVYITPFADREISYDNHFL